MKTLMCWAVLCAGLLPAVSFAAPATPHGDTLALDTAVRRALERHPTVRIRQLELRKAAGRVRQAGARPNPEAGLDFENFGGGGSPGPFESEATFGVGQLLELGGKRGARIGVAEAESGVLALDADAASLSLAALVTTRFVEAAAARREVELAADALHAAEEVTAAAERRVRAGAANVGEHRRALLEVAGARIELADREGEESVALVRLSLLWGQSEPEFIRVGGVLDSLPKPPSLARLAAAADSSPTLGRWRAEHEARRRRLELERSLARPDLRVSAGIRGSRDWSDQAYLVGVTVPLPIFDRNHGGIQEARADVEQSEHEASLARLEVMRVLADARGALERAALRLATLRTIMLPEAERAFEEVRASYQQGRSSYLDLVDARRTYLAARGEELDAWLVGQLALTEIELLVGRSVAGMNLEGRLPR